MNSPPVAQTTIDHETRVMPFRRDPASDAASAIEDMNACLRYHELEGLDESIAVHA
jgi:hypothetical protein